MMPLTQGTNFPCSLLESALEVVVVSLQVAEHLFDAAKVLRNAALWPPQRGPGKVPIEGVILGQ